MGRADTYLQPGAPDPVLPKDLVLDLAGRFLPDGNNGADTRFDVDESGGEARAYMLGSGIVVKTQRPHRLRPRTSLEKEAHVLSLLAGPLAGRIPRLFGYGREDTAAGPVEFLVMSRIRGCAALHAGLPAREALLASLADVLRSVHAADVTGLRDSGLLPADVDSAALRGRLQLGFADACDGFAAHRDRYAGAGAPERIAIAAVDALAGLTDESPVLLHSNPGPTHVFVGDGGLCTGLIDFGDAYASHPALDLRSWPDPADRIVLHEAYTGGRPTTRGFDAVWTVVMILADLNAMLHRADLAEAAGRDLALRLAQL
ncbi:phosphotransferase family protein [Arthrobacter sp. FB24]|uniref:phosphotransferase family protein n=1 Tax=Arthrobacter sp. (strain FB24) TaxID=290399 RepID=UPI0012EA84F8|nr:aminoglycoside phosphotransferase family protein [Arthrobacter sp. FB24]